jgi:hypothetical protein
MASSGMLRRVVLVGTYVSEELIACPSSPVLVTLMKEAQSSYKSHTV